MDSLIICFICAFPLILVLFFLTKSNSGKLPPGPTPLPIIGNLLQLSTKPHKSLAKLADIHGPIMSLKLGQITTIVISSATLAKEILQTHDLNLSDRTIPDAIRAQDHHLSMEWLPLGAKWRNLRKICSSYIFAIQKLDLKRDLRRSKIQQLIVGVGQSCQEGKAINLGQASFGTMLNTLSSSIVSLDLSDSSSDRAKEFTEAFKSILYEAGKPNVSDFFPFLRKLDPQGIRHRTGVYFGKLLGIFDGMIDERLELRKQPGYVPADDVLDILLTLNDEAKISSEILDRECLKHLFMLLLIAGSGTTSSTLESAMAELIQNPKTLSKARTELEQTIGKGKVVDELDITRLPYLQAIVKETFRLHQPVPLLIPRKARANVEIRGFIIPKGAQIMVNVYAIGRDGNTWKDPNSFMPERFLDSDIDVKGHNFELIPFGAGRRMCPGLPLAIRMLYPMLGSLINMFDWKIEDGSVPMRVIPYTFLNQKCI
ncbi:Cytochrome P450 76T24 [Euphorbia peplus]|nr:putative cytochrome P450 monooxygenase [Euphorbia peplus]WCJ37084.1 Cytochrome P450 76T24 [Euphorbia peplus]